MYTHTPVFLPNRGRLRFATRKETDRSISDRIFVRWNSLETKGFTARHNFHKLHQAWQLRVCSATRDIRYRVDGSENTKRGRLTRDDPREGREKRPGYCGGSPVVKPNLKSKVSKEGCGRYAGKKIGGKSNRRIYLSLSFSLLR